MTGSEAPEGDEAAAPNTVPTVAQPCPALPHGAAAARKQMASAAIDFAVKTYYCLLELSSGAIAK